MQFWSVLLLKPGAYCELTAMPHSKPKPALSEPNSALLSPLPHCRHPPACGSQLVWLSNMAAGPRLIMGVTLIVMCGQTMAAGCSVLCHVMHWICCEFACQHLYAVLQGVCANLRRIVYKSVGLLWAYGNVAWQQQLRIVVTTSALSSPTGVCMWIWMLQLLYFIIKYCRDLLHVVLRITMNAQQRCISALFFFSCGGVRRFDVYYWPSRGLIVSSLPCSVTAKTCIAVTQFCIVVTNSALSSATCVWFTGGVWITYGRRHAVDYLCYDDCIVWSNRGCGMCHVLSRNVLNMLWIRMSRLRYCNAGGVCQFELYRSSSRWPIVSLRQCCVTATAPHCRHHISLIVAHLCVQVMLGVAIIVLCRKTGLQRITCCITWYTEYLASPHINIIIL